MDVSMAWAVIIIFGGMLVLIALRMWIGVAIGVLGLFAIIGLAGMPKMISTVVYHSMSSYVLAAVPLFIFLGEIVLMGGLSERLYRGVSKWTCVIPGGLTHTNIVSCALFAAISGSSVGTAATIGTVAYPEQEKRGYDHKLTVGSLAAGGTLGPMIPPGIGYILYGAFVGESVGKLFIGAVFPGIMMVLMYMGYIFARNVKNPSLGPPRESITRRYFRGGLTAWGDIWPLVLIMGVIFGGIYGGLLTPTEAAGVSGCVAMIVILAFRRLTFKMLVAAGVKALEVTCMIFLIMVSAKVVAAALAMLMIPKTLVAMAGASGLHPWAIWGILIFIYLVLGCFIDAISMLYLTLAVVYPLMMGLGFDSVWFGVTLMKVLEIGLLTPPMGLNLYVIQNITKVPFWDVAEGSLPFWILILVGVIIVTIWPQIVLWLPSTML